MFKVFGEHIGDVGSGNKLLVQAANTDDERLWLPNAQMDGWEKRGTFFAGPGDAEGGRCEPDAVLPPSCRSLHKALVRTASASHPVEARCRA
ncbi:hypothetical protein BV97_01167 [Novosphingobium resinovorum]|uniref:Uncharacterized protein n=1 Tax=Novosphingobium resinovorum TaxID=158500 RepID=A0A031K433_9SPHN|nr:MULTISPECIES: hypothetical protein [Novosphingobium]EZP83974.1 hypothetical protein BV97_01167 [Novosphingobium resinovorum]